MKQGARSKTWAALLRLLELGIGSYAKSRTLMLVTQRLLRVLRVTVRCDRSRMQDLLRREKLALDLGWPQAGYCEVKLRCSDG